MRDFNFNPTSVNPLSDVSVSVAPVPSRPLRTMDSKPNEFEALMNSVCSPKRARLEWFINELHVEIGDAHYTKYVPNGWRDERTGDVLTFKQAEVMIDARITELNLDKQLIEQWLQPGDHGLAEIQAFWNMSFEERMQRFRK